ncbi:hypothetical protein Ddye_023721 [Dipteronia dyeriana]|uniref:Uncharacterized protein n=1 Tax=Dipteronia dyeriana TaxID=168575 RepID=A0AAD9WTI4_9ROSI|nr:hypothetical protein Ddye_023721 [Dipteronia dyeriana]
MILESKEKTVEGLASAFKYSSEALKQKGASPAPVWRNGARSDNVDGMKEGEYVMDDVFRQTAQSIIVATAVATAAASV